MFNKRVVVVAVALACLFAVLPTGMYAQTAGTVDGLVTDTSGAAIAGATVTLTDKATGSALTMTTNEAGRYVFVNVTPGAGGVACGNCRRGRRATTRRRPFRCRAGGSG